MNKWILRGAVVVALAVLALLWLRRGPADAPVAANAANAANAAREPMLAHERGGVGAAPAERAAAVEPAQREQVVADAEPAPAAAPTEAAPQRALPPRDAKEWLSFRVVNAREQPIPDAQVALTGLRKRDEAGSHYMIDDPQATAKTDKQGRARVAYPYWLDERETGFVTIAVTHPDYSRHEADMIAVDPQEKTVVLLQGAVLIVCGWIGSPERCIADVKPSLSRESGVEPDTWVVLRDGRLSNANVNAGKHSIRVRHQSADGVVYYSRSSTFTIESGEQKELSIELVRAARLVGRLDPRVPRPIVDGQVGISLSYGHYHQGDPPLATSRVADVAADGSFAFEDLPFGDAQVIGLCDGWAASGVAVAPDAEDATDAAIATERDREPQGLVVPHEGEFVLAMEPAASLEVTLEDASGARMPNMRLAVWPNVVWRYGASQLYLNREFEVVTNANGVALLESLPPGRPNFGLRDEHFDLTLEKTRWGELDRHRNVELESGEVTRITCSVEPKQR